MNMNMQRLSGEDGHVIVAKIDMEDPDFESETPHIAHALFRNPKSVKFDYEAQLYIGKTIGDKVASSGLMTFSLPAGGSGWIDFTLNMPRLTIPQDSYHVYLDVSHLGTLLITFIGKVDIGVFVTPAVDVIEITWD